MNVLIPFFAALTFLISSFGQLQRWEFFHSRANVYLFEIPMILTLLLLIWQYKDKPFESIRLHQFGGATSMLLQYMMVVFAVSVFFFSAFANVVAGLYLLRIISYLLFIIYFFYYCSKQKHLPKAFSFALLSFIGLLVLTAAAQYYYYPDLRNLFYAGWDPHYFRLFGLYFEPVIAASVYGIMVIYLIVTNTVSKYIRIPLAFIFFVFIVATYSRAAWVAFGVASIFYVARKKFLKVALIGLAAAVVIFVLLPKPSGEGVNILRTSTILSRSVDYEEGISIWSKNFLFGIGYNHLPAVKQTPQTNSDIPNHAAGSLHSSFLIILATGGIIGFLFFLNWFLEMGTLSPFLTYASIFVGVCAVFDNVLLHPFILLLMAIVGGMSLIRPSDTSV